MNALCKERDDLWRILDGNDAFADRPNRNRLINRQLKRLVELDRLIRLLGPKPGGHPHGSHITPPSEAARNELLWPLHSASPL